MTFQEMEKTLIGLAHIQGENQKLLTQTLGAVNKLSKLVVEFAEIQNAGLERLAEQQNAGLERLAEQQNTWLQRLAEQQNASLLRLENAVERLTTQVEASVRGRSHNGRKQKS